jgi:DNA-binding IclR family transcriptional regulator
MVRSGLVTIVDKVDPPEPIVRYTTLGSRMPLHATAAGKAALGLDPAELEALRASGPLLAYTPSTIVDFAALDTEVERVRDRHYATEQNEYHLGFSCVGVAFRLADDLVTISMSGPQLGLGRLRESGEHLHDTLAAFLLPYGRSAVQL